MCLSPALPSGEDLVRHQLELQLILQEGGEREIFSNTKQL